MTRATVLVVMVGLAAGCGGPQGARPGEAVNTGLATLATGHESGPMPVEPPPKAPETPLERAAQKSALDLQKALEDMDHQPAGGAPAGRDTPASMKLSAMPPAPPAPEPVTEPPKPAAQTVAPPAQVAPDAAPAAASEKPLAQRIDETAMLLVDLLRQRAVSEPDPRRTYIALAALETLKPGASQQIITPRSLAADPLSPEDRAAVDGLRDLVTQMAGAPSAKALAASIRELQERAGMNQRVHIGAARLCSRVSGFGRFSTLASSRLMQGRPQRAIVYVELAAFAQRPVTESEASAAESPSLDGRPRFAVDVSQELKLYHDADGVLAWQQPEQRILEASVNRRRDFYLVQQITLPETLTIGAYRLKVVVRDRTTGNQDEASIPIEIVADPTLALHRGD